MTVEWYDLAQRLYAARSTHPVARLRHSPLPTITLPIAVRAAIQAGSVLVSAALPGQAPASGRDLDGLRLLADHGVQITADTPHTLITDDPGTLPALLSLARRADPDGEHAATAAQIAWWADRADFPGTSAVADLIGACRLAWITGTLPDAERHAATWRAWLGITDDATSGLFALLDRLSYGPPLGLLSWITEDDTYSWGQAQSEHADGWDWRRPDTPGRAATALRARCDAADLHAGALLSDPLYRRRAVHTGHVVHAVAGPVQGNRLTVTCERLDGRMRAGTSLIGWAGTIDAPAHDTFAAGVHATSVAAGRLLLTLSRVNANRPSPGTRIVLCPAPPDPHQMRRGRQRYRQLYASRSSWLTTGRTPVPIRRDVPLDVLVAGAEAS